MNKHIKIPGFIFKPVYTENTTIETIKRQEDVLEIEFPVFDKEFILETAKNLSLKKRRAHDRHIDDILNVIDQVGDRWRDPNYDIRKEALEIIPMMTGQSKQLCEIELMGTLFLWEKKTAEGQLLGEIGGKHYLEDWVPKLNTRIHAQPRGVVLHNLAGNAFNLGLLTVFYGLITKNVNLIKLSHEDPYMTIKLCESIADVDKKISKEIAALYWKGSRGDIYDDLFSSGNINCVLAWGGIQSIEDIRRRGYRYGIKIIDNGPKLSFSVISEDIFADEHKMEEIAQRIAIDVVCWNQKACLSPRVLYVVDKPQQSTIFQDAMGDYFSNGSDIEKTSDPIKSFNGSLDKMFQESHSDGFDMKALMKRSIKGLRNKITELSPLGFAKMLARGLKTTDQMLPRANLTQADGLQIAKKREYFFMNHAIKKNATIINPPNNGLDWTVVYLRNLPSMMEMDMCQDRFIIVTRISSIQDLIHKIRTENLQQYLQTISLFGSEEFIKNTAEEFSLIGAYRFPRIGEHNIQPVGMPWDGHYLLQDMIKWVYIGFLSREQDEIEEGKISLYKDLRIPNKSLN
ncbi:MAG: hypothetical protein JW891_00070 [Candidatus Lokiarchaeota archaeon]|nr:hypothetical protein [Candidatus Lokiarchaeota archaeon]